MREVVNQKDNQKRIMQLYVQGAKAVEQQLPMLIGGLFSKTMKDFDYPETPAGYKEMQKGVFKHGWNVHVKQVAHEVERKLRMPLGSFFEIPPDDGEETELPPLEITEEVAAARRKEKR